MAEKLKIISLGGLNEIGKNMTVYEYKGDIIVVDCGLAFPDDDMYGIDIVIPDVGYLIKNASRIKAILITHGHEDHIGALPYVLKQLKAPVYATRLAAGIAELKLQEHGLSGTVQINIMEAGKRFKAGCFTVEPINVNHSIPDAVSLALHTPVGVVVHTGDFKIDPTPIQGEMIDLARFGELGKKGVLALLSDSTNVERPGYTISERKVGSRLDALFEHCDKRIIITTFASNVHRVQQVINSAAKHGRKIGITGRSMENMMRVATELGYINVPDGVLMEMSKIRGLPKEKVVIITTGSQGETMSALYRMAFSAHKQVEIGPGDRVIISASAIPGNEKTVNRVINELFYKGAEVISKIEDLHVSGHACQEELKLMLGLVKPKFFIPVHGEHRHLRMHAELAKEMGIPAGNILISEIGKVIEVNSRGIKVTGSVNSGKVLVDGAGVGDVGSVVLRDRKHLAQDGMIVVVVSLASEDSGIISGPDIITRGFVYVKDSEALMENMRKLTLGTIEQCLSEHENDWATIKASIKSDLSDFLYKTTKRKPMILPVIMEI